MRPSSSRSSWQCSSRMLDQHPRRARSRPRRSTATPRESASVVPSLSTRPGTARLAAATARCAATRWRARRRRRSTACRRRTGGAPAARGARGTRPAAVTSAGARAARRRGEREPRSRPSRRTPCRVMARRRCAPCKLDNTPPWTAQALVPKPSRRRYQDRPLHCQGDVARDAPVIRRAESRLVGDRPREEAQCPPSSHTPASTSRSCRAASRPIIGRQHSTTAVRRSRAQGPGRRSGADPQLSEYDRIFGGLWVDSRMGFAVRQYFQNGGREAVIVRVARGVATRAATSASALLRRAAARWTRGVEPGSVGRQPPGRDRPR